MRQLVLGAGFADDNVETGSWGNRACVIAHLEDWVRYKPLPHSLESDPRFPIVVWAFAREPETD